MPRRPRFATGGYVYHVLNRAVGRATLFEKAGDDLAFERVLEEARRQVPVRLLAYGALDWQQRTAKALSLESTLRPWGRPRKAAKPA